MIHRSRRNLRQKRWFQFSHCELSIYRAYHGSYKDFFDRGLLLTQKILNQGFLLVNLKLSLRKFNSRYHDLIIPYGICVKKDLWYVPLVISTSWSFPHSRHVTWFVTRVTLRMPPVEQELLTIQGYPRSLPGFRVVRVARLLVYCLVYYRYIFRCLPFFVWSLCCLSFIYGIRPLWYIQTLLKRESEKRVNNLKSMHRSCCGMICNSKSLLNSWIVRKMFVSWNGLQKCSSSFLVFEALYLIR